METTLGKFFAFLQSELSFDKDVVEYYLFQFQSQIAFELELGKIDKFAFMRAVESIGKSIEKICDYPLPLPLNIKVWDTDENGHLEEPAAIVFEWTDTTLRNQLSFMLLAAYFFQPLEIEERLKFFGFSIFAITGEKYRNNFENQPILVEWCSKITPQPNF
jgi:hypothetical protein